MTANAERGEVPLQIEGVEYVLVLGFNGLIALQNMFTTDGKKPTVESILARVTAGDFEAFRAVFWALFQRHHPDVTLARAGELIDAIGGLPALDRVLALATEMANPHPKDVAAMGVVNGRPPQAATGRRRRGGTGTTSRSSAADAA